MFPADNVFTSLENKDYFTTTTVFEFLEATQAKKTSLKKKRKIYREIENYVLDLVFVFRFPDDFISINRKIQK